MSAFSNYSRTQSSDALTRSSSKSSHRVKPHLTFQTQSTSEASPSGMHLQDLSHTHGPTTYQGRKFNREDDIHRFSSERKPFQLKLFHASNESSQRPKEESMSGWFSPSPEPRRPGHGERRNSASKKLFDDMTLEKSGIKDKHAAIEQCSVIPVVERHEDVSFFSNPHQALAPTVKVPAFTLRPMAPIPKEANVHVTKNPLFPKKNEVRYGSQCRVVLHFCSGLPTKHFVEEGTRTNKDAKLYFYLRCSNGTRFKSDTVPFSASADLENQHFEFPIEKDGKGVTLTITCAVETAAKKVKIGVAQLYLGNQRRSKSVYCVSLIGKSGTEEAKDRGFLHLTVVPQGYGDKGTNWISLREEITLRRQLRGILSSSPEGLKHLHKLETYVALCRPQSSQNVRKYLQRLRVKCLHSLEAAKRSHSQRTGWVPSKNKAVHRVQLRAATTPAVHTRLLREGGLASMTLRVQGVCDLLTADGDPLPSSLSCTVDIYRCTPKKSGEVTREHVACVSSLYESLCAADFLPKEIPLTTKSGCDFLHIVVSSGNERCNTEVGACDISLKYLNMGGTSEYLLVGGWTTPYAYGCGRVQLQFTTARSAAVRRPQQELHNFLNVRRKWRERVQSLLWATDKSQLHQCDLALDKVAEFGWNRFLQRQERVRSPPPSFRMEFKFLRWRFTSSGAPQPLRSCDDSAQLTHSNTTSKEGSFFVVLTCGVHHFVSPLFHGQQSSDAISLEGIRCRAMTVIPSSDFCRFSIFKSTPQSCVEVATAEVPLSCLVSPERQIIQVPLVTLAKRIGAALHGVLEVEVRTKGTATTQGTAWGGWEETNTRRQTLLKHLHYNASWKLHRALCILANDWRTYPSHVDYNIVCRETYGPLREQVMSKLSIVKVVSQSEVLASASVQLKVYYQDNCVMRSGVVFQEDGSATVKNNHVETLVVDPDHTSLTIVLSETHLLSSSKTLARATVSASAIQSVHQPTEMWVHFYNVKTHSPLCEMSFTLTTPQTSAVRSPDYRSSLAVEDSAYRDVLSLLAVHAPKEAGKAHSLFSSFVNRAAAHSCLRSLLLPEPVACTIYIHVEGLTSSFANVFALDDKKEFLRVTFHYSGSECSTVCPSWNARKSVSNSDDGADPLHASCMRLEIPVPLSNVDTVRDPGVVVTIEHCVRKERGRSHSRFRSLSRNSRNSSCASSTFSSSCPRSCSSRANSTDRDTVQSAETKTVEDITATEIGRVKLSLRALLSKHLYPKGEVISVPIVANTRCIANRLPIERHTEFLRRVSEDYDHVPDMCILGSLSFSIQLPVGERIPLWLQLPACHKRRRAEYERGLSGTEVDDILHAHYDIFETGSILKEVGWETKSTSTTPTKRNTGDKLRLSRSSESSGVNMVSDSDPSSADVTYIHRSTIF